MANAIGQSEQINRGSLAAGALGAGKGGGVVDVVDEPRDDGGEIGGLPIAVDEAFAKANVAGEDAFAKEGVATNLNFRGGRNPVAQVGVCSGGAELHGRGRSGGGGGSHAGEEAVGVERQSALASVDGRRRALDL